MFVLSQLNRSERRNAMNPEVAYRIRDTFGSIKPGGDVRVVVLHGVGEDAFCSGADLTAIAGERDAGDILQKTIDSIIACPCPVIEMIYGHAVGAGCDLAAACDFRIISALARIGINPVKLGLIYFPQINRKDHQPY